MINALADSLTDALLNELPPDRAYDRATLQTEALPDSVSHFLRHALKERAEHEMTRLHRARSNWVDYDAEDVREAQEALVRAAGRYVQVPADAWETTLRRAVRETGAYLVRPRATLTRFAFDDHETASTHHILQRVRFFSPYSYFSNVLQQYVERRDLKTMQAERFAGMLRRIDRQMTEDYTPAQWSRLLEPLFAFVERAPQKPRRAVPASLLCAFFEEKERGDLSAQLQHIEELTRDELRRSLENSGEQPAAAQHDTPDEEQATPRQNDDTGASESGPVPLWKQFQPGQRGGAPEKKRDRSSGSRSSSTESPSPDEAAPRWQQFRSGSASPSSGTSDLLDDLERKVLGGRGADNRSFYVSNLFGGSREAYRETLRRLREVESWSEAQQVVAREVFRKHQVNIYSDAAVSFTDAVQQRFR